MTGLISFKTNFPAEYCMPDDQSKYGCQICTRIALLLDACPYEGVLVQAHSDLSSKQQGASWQAVKHQTNNVGGLPLGACLSLCNISFH